MKPEEPRNLFVYGTLMLGSRSPYARLLQTRSQFIGKGFARGKLFNFGRFPGAVFDESVPSCVHGEVFRLRSAALLRALDAYEGCRSQDSKPHLFRRDIVRVHLSRTKSVTAWAYSFAGDSSGRVVISCGLFRIA